MFSIVRHKGKVMRRDYEMEPDVMEAEVEWAIKQLKDNKHRDRTGYP